MKTPTKAADKANAAAPPPAPSTVAAPRTRTRADLAKVLRGAEEAVARIRISLEAHLQPNAPRPSVEALNANVGTLLEVEALLTGARDAMARDTD